ncbi:MAG: hypothetical protein PHZ00_06385 [Candidatus Peribacteraceae bacterium]|nr:hypothetical protein [Candidatus Peribacteraceae bacterium]
MYTLMRLLIVTTVYAQNLGPRPGGVCDTNFFWKTNTSGNSGGFGAPGSGFDCIAEYIMQITYIVIGFTASLALIMLMINGFRYMVGPAMPGGSSDAAKKGITAALIGVVVSLLTYAIIDTVLYYITS